MSDTKFNCQACGQSLEAPLELSGKIMDCPSCGSSIVVPGPQLKPSGQGPRATGPSNVEVEVKRGANPLGIAALIIGIICCLFCWVPFLGLLSIPITLIGLLLAAIGFFMALLSRKSGFIYPVSGGIVCAIALAIPLFLLGGCTALLGSCAKAASDAAENAKRTNQVVTPANAPQTTVKPGEAAQPTPKTAPLPEAKPSAPVIEWADASNAVRQGDIQVKVKALKVGKVELKSTFGDNRESEEKLLSITLEVSNLSEGRKIDFTTWRGAAFSIGNDSSSLGDNNGNTYKRITFGSSSRPIGGMNNRESIYPGKTLSDVLIFERPVDSLKWLHLELPGGNFGGSGMIRLEIPATMISR